MIDAGTLLTASRIFLIVWTIVVLVHGLLLSLSEKGNPLPPEAPEHHDH
jgi:hypothetical protein